MRCSLILPVLGLFIVSSCFGPDRRAPVSVYGTSAGAGSAGVHTVLAGDTLYSISKRYRIAMQDIAISNRIGAPFGLDVGQRLKLPPPREYRVRALDNLYTVSRLFNVNRADIARLNNLQPPYNLQPGQVLRLPSPVQKQVRVASVSPSPQPSPRGEEGAIVKPGQKPSQGQPVQTAKASKPKKNVAVRTRAPKRSSSKFKKPVEGRVISTYGPKKDGLYNDGINIKAPRGTPVRAAENGVVVYAGDEIKGSGNLILVRHQDRWMTAYAHMDGFKVKRGDVIKRGQAIGTVGSTGSVDSPQLHFEVRRGTEAINPTVYLDKS